MLVDDSAVIRGALARIIESDPSITIVASVSNGEMAITSAGKYKPHVVIMDVEMPVMDGITALPEILKVSRDSKVIMFSTLTEKGADITLKAMSLGAVECFAKPSSTQAVGQGSDFQRRILSLIKSLTPENIRRPYQEPGKDLPPPAPFRPKEPGKPQPYTLRATPPSYRGKPAAIAIGSSTGGPQALFTVLPHCKGYDGPIVITQHMPATFTKILAEHLGQQTGIPSKEGEEGEILQGGHIYVAPGGKHMVLEKDGNGVKIRLDDGPPVNFCKPAVDPMMESLIKIYGNKVLGVILTGMGSDGIGGGRALAEVGGMLIAQDEASSVVWGMPGAVATAGLCSEVLPVDEIGPRLKKAFEV